MGVWIETKYMLCRTWIEMSHPAWVCGLKHLLVPVTLRKKKVTPCVGVWIETMILERAL